MTSENKEKSNPGILPHLTVNIKSPEFEMFMQCGLSFMRNASCIVFSSMQDWESFCADKGRDLVPWVYLDPRLIAQAQEQIDSDNFIRVVAVLANPTSAIVVDGFDIKLLPGYVSIIYNHSHSRVFNSRVAAMKDCSARGAEWWDDVVVSEVSNANSN